MITLLFDIDDGTPAITLRQYGDDEIDRARDDRERLEALIWQVYRTTYAEGGDEARISAAWIDLQNEFPATFTDLIDVNIGAGDMYQPSFDLEQSPAMVAP